MSREYPCIYFENDGKCRKFSDDNTLSYCVMGPCQEQTLSNAERIRAMNDEELAVFLDDLTCLCVDCNDHDGVNENCPIYKQGCGRYCEPKDLMDWLQQPAEED